MHDGNADLSYREAVHADREDIMNDTATKSAGRSPAKSTTKAALSAEPPAADPLPTGTTASAKLKSGTKAVKASPGKRGAAGKAAASEAKTADAGIAATRSASARKPAAAKAVVSKAAVKNSGNEAVTSNSDDRTSESVAETARSPAKAAASVTQHNDAQMPADTIQPNVVSKAQEVATKTMKSSSAADANKPVLTEEEIVKMSEKDYMNSAQLAFFKARLQQLEKDLLRNAGETTEHLRETVLVPDPADRATIEEEHALELRTRDRERKLLKKVQQSIAAIDAGDYGWCEETGEPIGIPRLLARPTATLSVEAQQRRELKQKLYGD